jgi:hypothetical protein
MSSLNDFLEEIYAGISPEARTLIRDFSIVHMLTKDSSL